MPQANEYTVLIVDDEDISLHYPALSFLQITF